MKVCPLGIVVRVLCVHVFIYLFSECIEALFLYHIGPSHPEPCPHDYKY